LVIQDDGWIHNSQSATITYNSLNWTGGKINDDGGTMDVVSGGGALTIPTGSNLYGNTARNFTNLTIDGNLSHTANGTTEDYKINYTMSGNTTISVAGTINVDDRGYAVGEGPGAGTDGSTGSGGGAYGGDGGDGYTRAGGTSYGDQYAPDRIGSGGGYYNGNGGSGGGAVKLSTSGITTVNGTISANGEYSNDDSAHVGGGGAGGSIWLVTNIFTGGGTMRANGGYTTDDNYDGGGGGGGRIAVYYNTDTSTLTATTVTGGDSLGTTGNDGQDGTIFFGGKSADPINLRQFKADGITAVSQGSNSDSATMIATFQVQDGNDSDTLTPEVEIQPLGTDFNDVATHTGDDVVYNGTIVTADVSVDGLADSEDYHWQARACDATDLCSNWVSFGNNTEADADISIVLNTAPNVPTIPLSSFFIDGQFSNDLQPTLGFVLSDSNNLDSVKYQLYLLANQPEN
jgi:hypothetical protein